MGKGSGCRNRGRGGLHHEEEQLMPWHRYRQGGTKKQQWWMPAGQRLPLLPGDTNQTNGCRNQHRFILKTQPLNAWRLLSAPAGPTAPALAWGLGRGRAGPHAPRQSVGGQELLALLLQEGFQACGSLHGRLQQSRESSEHRGRAAAPGQHWPRTHLVLPPKAAHALLLPQHRCLHPEQRHTEGLRSPAPTTGWARGPGE